MIDFLQLDKEEILTELSERLMIENHLYLVYLFEQFVCYVAKHPELNSVYVAIDEFIETL